jgi:opacity protein-like surface antigen
MQQKTTFSLFLLYVCLISYSNTTKAQSLGGTSHKLGLSLNLGTTPGIDIGYAISPKITARLGYSYFKYNTNTTATTSGEEVKLGGDANVSIASLSFEYHPFKRSSFKLMGGASYFDKGQIAFVVTPTGTYKFGSTTFTPEEVGNVQFTVDYGKQYTPFAGIGFGRTIPKRRVGFGFEVGSYYTQTPKVTLTGDKRLSSMSEQQAKVQENMKDWKSWPVVNLRLAIRLD